MARTSLGRLTARPPRRDGEASSGPSGEAPERARGLHRLGLGGRRDGVLVIPDDMTSGRPLPLVVALHGAGGTGRQMADLVGPVAASRGVAVLAPDSRDRTWDVILGGYGPDVAFLDEALAATFATVPVGPDAVSVGGFSDGASYALSIGLANGDLFGRVVAYSPGFLAAPTEVGRPRIFVSHGTQDAVLPIDRCSRRLVPTLRGDGFDVRYDEFSGGHVVPQDVLADSFDWLLEPGPLNRAG
jgi:phospholipase/carboxylesterase